MRVVETNTRARVVMRILALLGLGLLAGFILSGLRPHTTPVGTGDTSVQ
jgi:hypothetical protein